MSYFTLSSTEYDLPHPTLSRNQPRFYIPDRSAYSPGGSTAGHAPGETLSMHSRHQSRTVSSPGQSGRSTPYQGSFSSLAALRHALHAYHNHHAATAEPLTPPKQISHFHHHRAPVASAPGGGGGASADYPAESEESSEWAMEPWVGAAHEPMEALIDIHRVLYRGCEDPAAEDSPEWSEQGKEVRRVVEQWFEDDCGES